MLCCLTCALTVLSGGPPEANKERSTAVMPEAILELQKYSKTKKYIHEVKWQMETSKFPQHLRYSEKRKAYIMMASSAGRIESEEVADGNHQISEAPAVQREEEEDLHHDIKTRRQWETLTRSITLR